MRAVAVLAVIGHHSELSFLRGGFIGVDVFFVLSGYLITSLLVNEVEATGRIDIWRFLANRAVRLWPALWMMLFTVIVVGPQLWPWVNVKLVVILSLLFLTDFVGAAPIVGHTWSLSVEEHFYFLWPLAVMAIAPLTRRGRVRVLLIGFVVATLWRLANAAYFETFELSALRFDTRLSGLILGGLISVSGLSLKGTAANLSGVAALVVLGAFAATLSLDALPVAFAQPVIDLASAALIIALIGGQGTAIFRVFSLRPVVYVGTISYGIYLWHNPVIGAVVYAGQTNPAMMMLLGTAISILIASASYAFVEKPLQDWRHRRFATA